MTIKDCINKIYPSLTAVVDGTWIEPHHIPYPDGTIGLKFACPYCMNNFKRPSKKKEKCAVIFQGKETPSGFRPYIFKCSRCMKTSISIHQFLKEHYPLAYRDYMKENNAKKNNFKPDFS